MSASMRARLLTLLAAGLTAAELLAAASALALPGSGLPRSAVLRSAVARSTVAPAAAARSAAVGHAVEGVDRSRLLAPAAAAVRDYANAGYRLRRVGGEVRVEVDTSPLQSASRFALPERPPAEPISRLARSLTAGAGTHYEAVSRVLGWMARSIDYDFNRGAPQDAAAVLARRRGYCTGVARLTVALLEAVDIPAREVAGYVAAAAGEGQEAGYHRWIEAHLPDRGWVFSDPLRSHHYVPATYLRLASDDLRPEQGLEGLLVARRNGLAVVDLYPPGAAGITARRNSGRRLAAALGVHVEEASTGLAELDGAAQRRTRALVDGGTTFVGLAPGEYRLRLTLPGREVLERTVELVGRARKILSLVAPEPARTDRKGDDQ